MATDFAASNDLEQRRKDEEEKLRLEQEAEQARLAESSSAGESGQAPAVQAEQAQEAPSAPTPTPSTPSPVLGQEGPLPAQDEASPDPVVLPPVKITMEQIYKDLGLVKNADTFQRELPDMAPDEQARAYTQLAQTGTYSSTTEDDDRATFLAAKIREEMGPDGQKRVNDLFSEAGKLKSATPLQKAQYVIQQLVTPAADPLEKQLDIEREKRSKYLPGGIYDAWEGLQGIGYGLSTDSLIQTLDQSIVGVMGYMDWISDEQHQEMNQWMRDRKAEYSKRVFGNANLVHEQAQNEMGFLKAPLGSIGQNVGQQGAIMANMAILQAATGGTAAGSAALSGIIGGVMSMVGMESQSHYDSLIDDRPANVSPEDWRKTVRASSNAYGLASAPFEYLMNTVRLGGSWMKGKLLGTGRVLKKEVDKDLARNFAKTWGQFGKMAGIETLKQMGGEAGTEMEQGLADMGIRYLAFKSVAKDEAEARSLMAKHLEKQGSKPTDETMNSIVKASLDNAWQQGFAAMQSVPFLSGPTMLAGRLSALRQREALQRSGIPQPIIKRLLMAAESGDNEGFSEGMRGLGDELNRLNTISEGMLDTIATRAMTALNVRRDTQQADAKVFKGGAVLPSIRDLLDLQASGATEMPGKPGEATAKTRIEPASLEGKALGDLYMRSIVKNDFRQTLNTYVRGLGRQMVAGIQGVRKDSASRTEEQNVVEGSEDAVQASRNVLETPILAEDGIAGDTWGDVLVDMADGLAEAMAKNPTRFGVKERLDSKGPIEPGQENVALMQAVGERYLSMMQALFQKAAAGDTTILDKTREQRRETPPASIGESGKARGLRVLADMANRQSPSSIFTPEIKWDAPMRSRMALFLMQNPNFASNKTQEKKPRGLRNDTFMNEITGETFDANTIKTGDNSFDQLGQEADKMVGKKKEWSPEILDSMARRVRDMAQFPVTPDGRSEILENLTKELSATGTTPEGTAPQGRTAPVVNEGQTFDAPTLSKWKQFIFGDQAWKVDARMSRSMAEVNWSDPVYSKKMQGLRNMEGVVTNPVAQEKLRRDLRMTMMTHATDAALAQAQGIDPMDFAREQAEKMTAFYEPITEQASETDVTEGRSVEGLNGESLGSQESMNQAGISIQQDIAQLSAEDAVQMTMEHMVYDENEGFVAAMRGTGQTGEQAAEGRGRGERYLFDTSRQELTPAESSTLDAELAAADALKIEKTGEGLSEQDKVDREAAFIMSKRHWSAWRTLLSDAHSQLEKDLAPGTNKPKTVVERGQDIMDKAKVKAEMAEKGLMVARVPKGPKPILFKRANKAVWSVERRAAYNGEKGLCLVDVELMVASLRAASDGKNKYPFWPSRLKEPFLSRINSEEVYREVLFQSVMVRAAADRVLGKLDPKADESKSTSRGDIILKAAMNQVGLLTNVETVTKMPDGLQGDMRKVMAEADKMAVESRRLEGKVREIKDQQRAKKGAVKFTLDLIEKWTDKQQGRMQDTTIPLSDVQTIDRPIGFMDSKTKRWHQVGVEKETKVDPIVSPDGDPAKTERIWKDHAHKILRDAQTEIDTLQRTFDLELLAEESPKTFLEWKAMRRRLEELGPTGMSLSEMGLRHSDPDRVLELMQFLDDTIPGASGGEKAPRLPRPPTHGNIGNHSMFNGLLKGVWQRLPGDVFFSKIKAAREGRDKYKTARALRRMTDRLKVIYAQVNPGPAMDKALAEYAVQFKAEMDKHKVTMETLQQRAQDSVGDMFDAGDYEMTSNRVSRLVALYRMSGRQNFWAFKDSLRMHRQRQLAEGNTDFMKIQAEMDGECLRYMAECRKESRVYADRMATDVNRIQGSTRVVINEMAEKWQDGRRVLKEDGSPAWEKHTYVLVGNNLKVRKEMVKNRDGKQEERVVGVDGDVEMVTDRGWGESTGHGGRVFTYRQAADVKKRLQTLMPGGKFSSRKGRFVAFDSIEAPLKVTEGVRKGAKLVAGARALEDVVEVLVTWNRVRHEEGLPVTNVVGLEPALEMARQFLVAYHEDTQSVPPSATDLQKWMPADRALSEAASDLALNAISRLRNFSYAMMVESLDKAGVTSYVESAETVKEILDQEPMGRVLRGVDDMMTLIQTEMMRAEIDRGMSDKLMALQRKTFSDQEIQELRTRAVREFAARMEPDAETGPIREWDDLGMPESLTADNSQAEELERTIADNFRKLHEQMVDETALGRRAARQRSVENSTLILADRVRFDVALQAAKEMARGLNTEAMMQDPKLQRAQGFSDARRAALRAQEGMSDQIPALDTVETPQGQEGPAPVQGDGIPALSQQGKPRRGGATSFSLGQEGQQDAGAIPPLDKSMGFPDQMKSFEQTVRSLPEIETGKKRLYRVEWDGEGKASKRGPLDDILDADPEYQIRQKAFGRWFGDSPEEVGWYAQNEFPDGDWRLAYVDLVPEEAERYRVANHSDKPDAEGMFPRGYSSRKETEFFVPRSVAEKKKSIRHGFPAGTQMEAADSGIVFEFPTWLACSQEEKELAHAVRIQVARNYRNADGTPIDRQEVDEHSAIEAGFILNTVRHLAALSGMPARDFITKFMSMQQQDGKTFLLLSFPIESPNGTSIGAITGQHDPSTGYVKYQIELGASKHRGVGIHEGGHLAALHLQFLSNVARNRGIMQGVNLGKKRKAEIIAMENELWARCFHAVNNRDATKAEMDQHTWTTAMDEVAAEMPVAFMRQPGASSATAKMMAWMSLRMKEIFDWAMKMRKMVPSGFSMQTTHMNLARMELNRGSIEQGTPIWQYMTEVVGINDKLAEITAELMAKDVPGWKEAIPALEKAAGPVVQEPVEPKGREEIVSVEDMPLEDLLELMGTLDPESPEYSAVVAKINKGQGTSSVSMEADEPAPAAEAIEASGPVNEEAANIPGLDMLAKEQNPEAVQEQTDDEMKGVNEEDIVDPPVSDLEPEGTFSLAQDGDQVSTPEVDGLFPSLDDLAPVQAPERVQPASEHLGPMNEAIPPLASLGAVPGTPKAPPSNGTPRGSKAPRRPDSEQVRVLSQLWTPTLSKLEAHLLSLYESGKLGAVTEAQRMRQMTWDYLRKREAKGYTRGVRRLFNELRTHLFGKVAIDRKQPAAYAMEQLGHQMRVNSENAVGMAHNKIKDFYTYTVTVLNPVTGRSEQQRRHLSGFAKKVMGHLMFERAFLGRINRLWRPGVSIPLTFDPAMLHILNQDRMWAMARGEGDYMNQPEFPVDMKRTAASQVQVIEALERMLKGRAFNRPTRTLKNGKKLLGNMEGQHIQVALAKIWQSLQFATMYDQGNGVRKQAADKTQANLDTNDFLYMRCIYDTTTARRDSEMADYASRKIAKNLRRLARKDKEPVNVDVLDEDQAEFERELQVFDSAATKAAQRIARKEKTMWELAQENQDAFISPEQRVFPAMGSPEHPIYDMEFVLGEYFTQFFTDEMAHTAMNRFLFTHGMTTAEYNMRLAQLPEDERAAMATSWKCYDSRQVHMIMSGMAGPNAHVSLEHRDYERLRNELAGPNFDPSRLPTPEARQLALLVTGHDIATDPDWYTRNIAGISKAIKNLVAEAEQSKAFTETYRDRVSRDQGGADSPLLRQLLASEEFKGIRGHELMMRLQTVNREIYMEYLRLNCFSEMMQNAGVYQEAVGNIMLPADIAAHLEKNITKPKKDWLPAVVDLIQRRLMKWFTSLVLYSGPMYNLTNLFGDTQAAFMQNMGFFEKGNRLKYMHQASVDLKYYFETGTPTPRLAMALRSGQILDGFMTTSQNVDVMGYADFALTHDIWGKDNPIKVGSNLLTRNVMLQYVNAVIGDPVRDTPTVRDRMNRMGRMGLLYAGLVDVRQTRNMQDSISKAVAKTQHSGLGWLLRDSTINPVNMQVATKGLAVARETVQRLSMAYYVADEMEKGGPIANRIWGGASKSRIAQSLVAAGCAKVDPKTETVTLDKEAWMKLDPMRRFEVAASISSNGFGDYNNRSQAQKMLQILRPFCMYEFIDAGRVVHWFENAKGGESIQVKALAQTAAKLLFPIVMFRLGSSALRGLVNSVAGGDDDDETTKEWERRTLGKSAARSLGDWARGYQQLLLYAGRGTDVVFPVQLHAAEFWKRGGLLQTINDAWDKWSGEAPAAWADKEWLGFLADHGFTNAMEWMGNGIAPWWRAASHIPGLMGTDEGAKYRERGDVVNTIYSSAGQTYGHALRALNDLYWMNKKYGEVGTRYLSEIGKSVTNMFGLKSQDRTQDLYWEYRFTTLEATGFGATAKGDEWEMKKDLKNALYRGNLALAKAIAVKMKDKNPDPRKGDDVAMYVRQFMKGWSPMAAFEMSTKDKVTNIEKATMNPVQRFIDFKSTLGRDDQLRLIGAYRFYGKLAKAASEAFDIPVKEFVPYGEMTMNGQKVTVMLF